MVINLIVHTLLLALGQNNLSLTYVHAWLVNQEPLNLDMNNALGKKTKESLLGYLDSNEKTPQV